jgi:hypothetical protein
VSCSLLVARNFNTFCSDAPNDVAPHLIHSQASLLRFQVVGPSRDYENLAYSIAQPPQRPWDIRQLQSRKKMAFWHVKRSGSLEDAFVSFLASLWSGDN